MILFAPSLDWNTQLFQRPQQMALALAREGALVFYPMPHPDLSQPPFERFADGLYICNVFFEVFEELENTYVYVLTWNSGHLQTLKSPRVIYDYVDDVDVFYGDKEEIAEGHQQLLQDAEIVIATALKLYNEVAKVRPDVLFLPNGVDFDHFQSDPTLDLTDLPEDLQSILEKRLPIVGYYGALARWFDYELVLKAAQLRPNYSFVLIGPDYDGTVEDVLFAERENIYWLGVKTYAELPRYLFYFDVATIPFVVNDITHAVSPLKLFEYMAGGKPVVVTPMQESMRYPIALVGSGPASFVEALDRAMELCHQPDFIARLVKTAKENTWDSRADGLLQAIRNADERIGVSSGISRG